MPNTNCTLADAPFASGVPKVIVPSPKVELTPPPFGCAGGVSSVVPLTVTVHGGGPALAAVHVAASFTPPTLTFTEVIGRRSATPPPGLGKVVTSTILNRNRVTLPPVLLTTRRLIIRWPNVALAPVVKSRMRLGTAADDTALSSMLTPSASRLMGDI